jgi:hypothetical protein
MIKQNINYGEKTQNSTSYVKKFNQCYNIYITNFRGEGTPDCFIKTFKPSKTNGSFVKTFNNYNYN